MAKRVKITDLKRTGAGVEITLISMTEPLLVSSTTAIHSRLEQGITLTSSQVELLVREAKIYACERAAVRLLARRSFSIGEFRQRLKQRGHESDIVDEIIRTKKKQGVLDDVKYAYAAARRLIEQRPCGRSYVKAALLKKLIPEDVAEKTVAAAFEGQNDTELAKDALRRRWWRFADLELESSRTKAYNYLSRRGFGYRTAREAFETVINEKTKDSSD